MVHYRTHKRPPSLPILCQPNPVHIPTYHVQEIHPNTFHPSTPRSPQWSLPFRFLHQVPISPSLLTQCSEQYRSFSSQLCNLLHSPGYLVPLRSKYSQHHILKDPQLRFLPLCQRPIITPIQNNRQNYSSIHLNKQTNHKIPLYAQHKPAPMLYHTLCYKDTQCWCSLLLICLLDWSEIVVKKIIIINCNLVVNRGLQLFYMYTKYEIVY